MENFRELLKPSAASSWAWTGTLRREFQAAKQEIIRRVEQGVKA